MGSVEPFACLPADLMERVERANLLLIAPLGEATDIDVITWWRYIQQDLAGVRNLTPDDEMIAADPIGDNA